MTDSLDDFFIKKISEEKQIDEFYARIIKNIYEDIRKAVAEGDRAIFFNLPFLRFGEALENPNTLARKIKEILKRDSINSFLIKKNHALMYIHWENRFTEIQENESKYGTKSLDSFIEKHRK